MRRITPLCEARICVLLLASVAWHGACSAAPPDPNRLKLPPGFSIEILAPIPNARMLAFSPGGALVVTSTNPGKVYVIAKGQGEGRVLLRGLNKPHGVAFHKGAMYLAMLDRIVRYDWDEQALRASNPRVIASLPDGGGHDTRTIVFNKGELYASVGSSCNVCVEDDPKRATVLEMSDSGANEQVFARGLRNAVGLAVNPTTGTVWTTENSRDNLGDDVPPDEIDDLGRNGGDFGWPYCYGDRVPDGAHQAEGEKRCASTVPPVAALQAHSAPLGLAFYEGTSFPPGYRNNLFVAYHGSWNRSVPTGYKVVRILNAHGQPQGPPQDFITGWMPDHHRTRVMGRPVGIAFGPDGAMYVTDDKAGVVYRVTYGSRNRASGRLGDHPTHH